MQSDHLKQAAEVFLLTKQNQQALQTYLEALALFEEMDDIENQAQVLNNIGLIESSLAQNESALAYFRQALELFERLGSNLHMAQQWGNLGSTYRNMEAYDNALDAYHHALPLYENLDHHVGIADQYTNIAYVYSMRGQLEEALELYQKASDARTGYKVILYFTREELVKVDRILAELKMSANPKIILIDARKDNKPSASKA